MQHRCAGEKPVCITLVDCQKAAFISDACGLFIHLRLRARQGIARKIRPPQRSLHALWAPHAFTPLRPAHRSTVMAVTLPCATLAASALPANAGRHSVARTITRLTYSH